jgi:integrase
MAKTRRRDAGNSKPVERKDGRWMAAYYREGKRVYAYGATAQEADDKRKAAAIAIATNEPVTNSTIRVGHLFDQWIAARCPKPRQAGGRPVTDWTIRFNERFIDKHLRPALGAIKVVDLTCEPVNEVLRKMAAENLSASVVSRACSILGRVLWYAAATGKPMPTAAREAARNATAPKCKPAIAREALDVEDVRVLLDLFKGHRLENAIILMVYTGMRKGEVCGLTWRDVDLQAGTVTIRRALLNRGKMVLGEPKNENGCRTIPLPPQALEALRRQRRDWRPAPWQVKARVRPLSQTFEGLSLREILDDHGAELDRYHEEERRRQEASRMASVFSLDGPVFASNTGGHIDLGTFGKAVRSVSGGDVFPHLLRHAAASRMLAAGQDPVSVAAYLGHDVRTLMKTYAHKTDEGLRSAAEAMAATY